MTFHEGFGADSDLSAVMLDDDRHRVRPDDLFDPIGQADLIRDYRPARSSVRLCHDCGETPVEIDEQRCLMCGMRHKRRMAVRVA